MHNNTNGVLVKVKVDSDETKASEQLVKHVAMHISALGPLYISYEEFPEDLLMVN